MELLIRFIQFVFELAIGFIIVIAAVGLAILMCVAFFYILKFIWLIIQWIFIGIFLIIEFIWDYLTGWR